jgi:hypothetical protein
MCMVSKERIAFCAQVERTRGEIFAASPIALQSRIISNERIAFCAQEEGTRGEMFAASPIALQSRCKLVPNEPIPTYDHSWPQCQSDRLKQETNRTRRNSETVIRGRYGTRRVELTPGAEYSATGMSLTALTERFHSDGAIPPGRKFFLLMTVSCSQPVRRASHLLRG